MLRRVSNVLCPSNPVLGAAAEDTARRLDPFISFVRWRKRRWAPITPSKLFRVNVKKTPAPGEKEELKMRYDHYKTTYKAIRKYLKEDLASKTALLTDQSHLDIEQQQFVFAQKENSLFNQRSAEIRQWRDVAEKKRAEETKLEMMLKLETEEKLKLESSRQNVLRTMRESSQFISRDSLQSNIEKMLDERRLFNFAVDLEGKRHVEQADGSTVVVDRLAQGSGSARDSRGAVAAQGSSSAIDSHRVVDEEGRKN